MDIPKRLFVAKFTANARSIAALIATCLAAYGLTMLSWLETNQQRDVQLNPREEAPDFLVTNARYLDFQPIKKIVANDIESATIGAQPQKGRLQFDIRSKTLSHYAVSNKTLFEKPIAKFSDQDNQAWLMTADNATTAQQEQEIQVHKGKSEHITLFGNVLLTSLSLDDLAMKTESITIDTAQETFNTASQITMEFAGGHIYAGGFRSALKTGNAQLSNGVKATYFLQRSTND